MSATCNIGPRGRRVRLLTAVPMLAIVGVALALPAFRGLPIAWRLLLFLPLAAAFLGILQARAGT